MYGLHEVESFLHGSLWALQGHGESCTGLPHAAEDSEELLNKVCHPVERVVLRTHGMEIGSLEEMPVLK